VWKCSSIRVFAKCLVIRGVEACNSQLWGELTAGKRHRSGGMRPEGFYPHLLKLVLKRATPVRGGLGKKEQDRRWILGTEAKGAGEKCEEEGGSVLTQASWNLFFSRKGYFSGLYPTKGVMARKIEDEPGSRHQKEGGRRKKNQREALTWGETYTPKFPLPGELELFLFKKSGPPPKEETGRGVTIFN